MQSVQFGNLGPVMAFATIVLGLATSLFWMWIGWRAMRAHERIADTLQDTGGAGRPPGANPL